MAPTAVAPESTRLAVWLLAVLAAVPCLLPMGGEPIPSFEVEAVTVGLGLAAWLAVTLGRGRPVVAVPGVVVLPLGLAVIVLGQIACATVAQTQLAVIAVLMLAWAALLACLGATLRRDGGTAMGVPVLAGAMLAAALANGLLATLQATVLPDGWPGAVLPMQGGRPGGNLGQPNHLAAYLALGAVGLGYLRITERIGAYLAVPLALGLAWGLALTGSRTAWLACGVLLFAALAFAPRLGAREGRSARRGAVLLALAVLTFTGVRSQGLSAAVSPGTGAAASAAERLTLWDGAWNLFLRAPIAGQGHGTFAFSFFGIVPDLPGHAPGVMTAHVHNLPLHVAAEYGIAGLLVLGAAGILWWQGMRRGRLTPESLWAMTLCGVCAVHSLVEYPLWFAYFLGPFALAAGLAEGPRLEFGLRRTGRFGAAALAVAGVIVLLPLIVDYAFLRSLAGPRGLPEATGERGVIRRIESLQKHSLLAGYADVGLHRGLGFGPEGLAQKVAFSRQVAAAMPLPDVVYRHALLLSAHGETDAARWWWGRAVSSYPDASWQWAARARSAGIRVPVSGRSADPTEIVRQREETDSWHSFSRTGG